MGWVVGLRRGVGHWWVVGGRSGTFGCAKGGLVLAFAAVVRDFAANMDWRGFGTRGEVYVIAVAAARAAGIRMGLSPLSTFCGQSRTPWVSLPQRQPVLPCLPPPRP